MRLIRVFPRKTKATPEDELAFVGPPPKELPQADKVHVSCTFSYDLQKAEALAQAWDKYYPTELGGPATGARGEEFVPGRYLKKGLVITSRGCPNKCWFCSVWKREGTLRELEIKEGHVVTDDNFLACSRPHIEKVFEMLRRQKEQVVFSGGLEAERLEPWHVDEILSLKQKPRLYFAFDRPDEIEPLRQAAELLKTGGLIPDRGHRIGCYVLLGYPKDTFELAERRLKYVLSLGITPFAMLYRNRRGDTNPAWRSFQRFWCRPSLIYAKGRTSATFTGEQ